MKTFLQHAKDTLNAYALFPSQIDTILSNVMVSPANDLFTGRWYDQTSDYPMIMTFLLERTIIREAIKHLEETLPEAWMLPALRDALV